MDALRFTITALFAASIVISAPLTKQLEGNFTEAADRHMRRGELLVVGDGRVVFAASIITADTWDLLLKTMNILPEAPEIDYDWLRAGDEFAEIPSNHSELGPSKRDCDSNHPIIIDRTLRFVDWDVQMSPVVIGTGSRGMDITISKSYSIANQVTVSAGLDVTPIKDRLKLGFGIDFSRTWTTMQGYLIRGTVDAGQTGVVITMPWTNRRYGRTFQGCVGNLRQTGTFMADSHEDGSYEGVTWVSGAITTCVKNQTSIPLSRCHGVGDFL
ncbi:uncharacterized protein CTRU02_204126 [Colletotrichum truncatum]|uniref:Uncharacterized protein n=1 Tax=Colletotrichum truncatum TaxID=5467 RepID=A0ACC3ZB63_COLTU|nr:uncharacterized protein CTRU02_09979 [Colletotrichum truncatum]KAF6787684.1 hypothetical protein CTRU02_09979 [Colletotrichum truncatum]